MIRLGLCCMFRDAPVRFRQTTATAMERRPRGERMRMLAALCVANADALHDAIVFCAAHGIGAFRVNSQILPLRTHPTVGYALADLPGGAAIEARFRACGRLRRTTGVRLSFHPDQFVVLNSPRAEVVRSSIEELVYHAEVARWIGADAINIHGGGAYGDKPSALARLAAAIPALPRDVRKHLTLENDDRTFTPSDLLPVCRAAGVPLVYDVHHHRCLPDGLDDAAATTAALATWTREPLFHLSSPRAGWAKGADWKPHHDFIDAADFPACWRGLDLTIDVEAKAKESAVLRLKDDLRSLGVPSTPPGGTCGPDSGTTRRTLRPGISNRGASRPALPRVTRGVRKVGS